VEPHSSIRRDPGAVPGQFVELLTSLEQALIAESDALRARDVDALERAVESKRRTLGLLARMPPAAGDAGSGNVEAAELLGRCRALNDAAGSAIAVLRQDVNHALELLGIESEAAGYGSPGGAHRKSRALAVC
jgi:flagellar biosynthesis/type III secretory pathway chaperone